MQTEVGYDATEPGSTIRPWPRFESSSLFPIAGYYTVQSNAYVSGKGLLIYSSIGHQ